MKTSIVSIQFNEEKVKEFYAKRTKDAAFENFDLEKELEFILDFSGTAVDIETTALASDAYEGAPIHQLAAHNKQIAILWDIEDVKGCAENERILLTDEQAFDVLTGIQRRHDANYGVTWDTIKYAIEAGDFPKASTLQFGQHIVTRLNESFQDEVFAIDEATSTETECRVLNVKHREQDNSFDIIIDESEEYLVRTHDDEIWCDDFGDIIGYVVNNFRPNS